MKFSEDNRKQNIILIFSLVFILATVITVGMFGYNFLFPASSDRTNETTFKLDPKDPFYGEDNITLRLSVPESQKNIIIQQCEDFKKLYKNKNIEIYIVALADVVQSLITDTKNAPDVFFFDSDKIDKLVSSKSLYPIFKLPNENAGIYKERITQNNLLDAVEAATVDDELFACPVAMDNGYVLFYNNKVLTEQDVKSFDKIIEVCKAGNKKIIMDAGKGFYSSSFLFTGGVRLSGLSPDGIQQISTSNLKELTDSVYSFYKLFYNNKETMESDEVESIINGFEDGTVAAGINGYWHLKDAKRILGDDLSFAVIPKININNNEKDVTSFMGYKLIGVKSSTNYQEASQLLAEYLSSEQCQRERMEKSSYPPTNINVAEEAKKSESRFLKAIFLQQENSVVMQGVSEEYWTASSNLGLSITDEDSDFSYEEMQEMVKQLLEDVS